MVREQLHRDRVEERRHKRVDGRKLDEGRQAYVIAPLVESAGDAERSADDAGENARQIASAEAVFESQIGRAHV